MREPIVSQVRNTHVSDESIDPTEAESLPSEPGTPEDPAESVSEPSEGGEEEAEAQEIDRFWAWAEMEMDRIRSWTDVHRSGNGPSSTDLRLANVVSYNASTPFAI